MTSQTEEIIGQGMGGGVHLQHFDVLPIWKLSKPFI